jgi:hypothetical protein
MSRCCAEVSGLSRLRLRSWLAIAVGLFAVLLGSVFLAAEPALASITPRSESRVSGFAFGIATLVEIETRLSEDGIKENVSFDYDLASDDAVAANAVQV